MAQPYVAPLTLAGALAEFQLDNAPQLTPDERRQIASRRVAAMSDTEYNELARRNQMRLDSAAVRLNSSAIAVHGPGARLLQPSPAKHAPGCQP